MIEPASAEDASCTRSAGASWVPGSKAVLAVAGLCLLPRLFFQVLQSVEAARLAPAVAATTLAQRSLATLGDRDGWGYGYLSDVTALFPEPDVYPRVRQATDLPTLQPLLPQYRPRVDPRFLVLAGIDETDVTEQVLAAPRQVGVAEGEESWSFLLQRSCDRLTRIELQFTAPAPRDCDLRVVLTDAAHPLGLRTWTARIAAGAAGATLTQETDALPLRQTLQDHWLSIAFPGPTAATPPRIREIKLWGIPIDLEPYETLHADGTCLTAIDRHFLEELIARDDPRWRQTIERLLQLPPRAEPQRPSDSTWRGID